MKTKKFNLEEALAGKPCVTRGGSKVVAIHHFKHLSPDDSVVFVLDTQGQNKKYVEYFGCSVDGKYFYDEPESNLDLLMLVEPHVYCIGIFKVMDEKFIGTTNAHPKEIFQKEFGLCANIQKVIEFTLDDEI